jgi:hypothetical protein
MYLLWPSQPPFQSVVTVILLADAQVDLIVGFVIIDQLGVLGELCG